MHSDNQIVFFSSLPITLRVYSTIFLKFYTVSKSLTFVLALSQRGFSHELRLVSNSEDSKNMFFANLRNGYKPLLEPMGVQKTISGHIIDDELVCRPVWPKENEQQFIEQRNDRGTRLNTIF